MAEQPETDAEARIRGDRIAKVAALRARGVDPYPRRFADRTETAELRDRYGGLEAGSEPGARARLAGRVMARRGHGRAMFLDLVDRSGRLQLQATADATDRYDELRDLDLGDVLGVEGEVFVSRRG